MVEIKTIAMHNINRYAKQLEELKAQGNFRFLRKQIPADNINLSSNDYLGLGNDSELYNEFLDENSIHSYPFSAAASRLLTGNSAEYGELETLLCQLFQSEAALVFNSGYHANCGILPALAGKNDLIVADKLVHASIIDGIRLAHTDFERFRHADYEHLEHILHEKQAKYENIFIVSESIFSMDGDCADLQKLVELKKKYNCLLYIDEAHAFGVRGAQGLGLAEEQDVIADIDLLVATFGKAIASMGAFVVCSEVLRSYLINHARTLIFTTALPPINIAWTTFILNQLPYLQNKRNHLQKVSEECAKLLQIPYQSHIIPYIVGSNEKAIALAETMQQNGFFVLPIRYPTVPQNTARLRLSLHANLRMNDIQSLIKELKNVIMELKNL
ncbi:MAG: 8-amino-7-oxononanoate synthase [Bacteroidales bacterium]|jgi:8-amino-7-oxononanoate synthase|nr:8-amino-7-oxononanoate synthase [Bacteroidales bacterium]